MNYYIYIYMKYIILNGIPKIIHQTYPTKNINSDIQNNINNLKKLNPDYKYILYDDDDIIDFIKNNYSQHILNTYNSINPEYGPARSDYFRYLLMYKKGGIYLDIKSSCDIPFDSIININKNDEFILTHWGCNIGDCEGYWSKELNYKYGEYCNWNIIIKKNHPLMKEIIDQVTYNINNYNIHKNDVGKKGVLFLTGPVAYSKVILNNKNNYKLTIYNNFRDIGLIYNIINNYTKLFKKHYTQIFSPIVYN
jgi:mannosyltransferase OCH1-like enzyme